MKKQIIEEQIKEIKAARENTQCSLNFYQDRVEFQNKQIAQFEKQLKECDELKLVDGYFFTEETTSDYPESSMSRYVEKGRCYPTKELAEIAMNNSNTRNKLEAYSREVDTKWREGVYKDNDWYIYLDDNGECFANNNSMKRLGEVRMSEKAARRIAKAINNSEITL